MDSHPSPELPLLAPGTWQRWCEREGLDPVRARVALDTVYHGVGILSSRPGGVFLFEDRLVFAPFSLRETLFALFSGRGRLELAVGEFAAEHVPVSGRVRFLFGLVADQAHLRLRTAGTKHDLLLQRGIEELVDELKALGVRVEGPSAR